MTFTSFVHINCNLFSYIDSPRRSIGSTADRVPYHTQDSGGGDGRSVQQRTSGPKDPAKCYPGCDGGRHMVGLPSGIHDVIGSSCDLAG